MTWFKRIGIAIAGAIAAFLALRAAQKVTGFKDDAKKWQETAVAEKEKNVADSVTKAKQALSQAKLANARAKEAKEQARKKLDVIAEKDPELAAVVSGWNTSRLRKPGS